MHFTFNIQHYYLAIVLIMFISIETKLHFKIEIKQFGKLNVHLKSEVAIVFMCKLSWTVLNIPCAPINNQSVFI